MIINTLKSRDDHVPLQLAAFFDRLKQDEPEVSWLLAAQQNESQAPGNMAERKATANDRGQAHTNSAKQSLGNTNEQ